MFSSENYIPSVSIIVLNYNGIIHLKECFNSLGNQTFKDFETILVDNGSTDGSIDFVKNNFPDVRVLSLTENYGFCKGNNLGISIAKGAFIGLLNNDTCVDPDWLLELYNGFAKDKGVGICTSRVMFYDNHDLIDTAGDSFSVCGAPFKRGHLELADKFRQSEYVFSASGCASLFGKSMLKETGVLDEDFFAIFEDGDLSFRCLLMGYRCLYVPSAIVYHKVNSTLGTLSRFHVYYGQRNVEYLYVKNMPTALIIRYFHLHFLYNILAGVYFFYKGKGLVFLKAKIDVIKELPKLLKKRSKIQKKRKVTLDYLKRGMEKHWLRSRMKRK